MAGNKVYTIDLVGLNPRVVEAANKNVRELLYVAIADPFNRESIKVILSEDFQFALRIGGDGSPRQQLVGALKNLPDGGKPWSKRVTPER